MPKVESKKAIVFVTHRLFGSGRAMGIMQKMLMAKATKLCLRFPRKA
jgi:hypothetical protein